MELSVRDVERLENTSFASAFANTAETGAMEPGGVEDAVSGRDPCTHITAYVETYFCDTVSICFTGTTSGVADTTDTLYATGVVTLLPGLELLDAARGA